MKPKKSRSLKVGVLMVLLCLSGAGWVVAAQQGEGHFQLHGKVVPLVDDGIHDAQNDALEILQAPADALGKFPRGADGIIDWSGALDAGKISPRGSLAGDEKIHSVDLDITMKNTSSLPYVRFPHMAHTKWLTCQNCHPAIFLPEKGGNFVTMADIMRGKFCGVCHGKVAFPPLECAKCHSIPREAANLR